MTDVDSLVEACIAEPADAAVRAVLADALEEQGDKRAARVRALLRWWDRAAALALPTTGDYRVKRATKRLGTDDLRRLWACLCPRWCPTADDRRVWDLLADLRSRQGLAVAELSWCGLAPPERLRTATDAAYAACRSASRVFAEESQEAHGAHAAYAAYAAVLGSGAEAAQSAPTEAALAAATAGTAGVQPATGYTSAAFRAARAQACRWAVALAALLQATPP
jgi:uncharacterized protein (TIGR02996 family)